MDTIFLQIWAYIFQSSYLAALLIFLFSIAAAEIVFFFFKKILMQLVKKTETEIDDKIIKILRNPVFYSVIAVGLLLSLNRISLSSKFDFYIDGLVGTFLVFIWILAVKKILDVILDSLKRKKKIKNIIPLIGNLSGIIIYFIGFLIVVKIWGYDITPILASAGIVGFAVALAAKDTIANFFGGITIFLDKPYKVGDIIQLESKEVGEIIKVGIRSTRIKTRDDTIITIPNSLLANSKIINLSEPRQKMRVNIALAVAYKTNIEKMEKILLEIAKRNKLILKDQEPRVRFKEFGENGLMFVLKLWVAEPFEKAKAIDQINREIHKKFRKEKIEIPYPQREVHLKK